MSSAWIECYKIQNRKKVSIPQDAGKHNTHKHRIVYQIERGGKKYTIGGQRSYLEAKAALAILRTELENHTEGPNAHIKTGAQPGCRFCNPTNAEQKISLSKFYEQLAAIVKQRHKNYDGSRSAPFSARHYETFRIVWTKFLNIVGDIPMPPTPEQIDHFFNTAGKEMNNASENTYARYIRLGLRKGSANGLLPIGSNLPKLGQIKKYNTKTVNPLTPEELRDILAIAQKRTHREYLMVALQCPNGCRPSDFTSYRRTAKDPANPLPREQDGGLFWDDINLPNGTFICQTKTGRQEKIMTPMVRKILEAWPDPKDDKPLIPWLTTQVIRKTRKIMRAAGVTKSASSLLRATSASFAARHDIMAAQALLNHTNVETTRRHYVSAYSEQMLTIYQRVDDLINPIQRPVGLSEIDLARLALNEIFERFPQLRDEMSQGINKNSISPTSQISAQA